MDIKFIKEIMREFQACELTKFELKYDDVEIKLEKKKEQVMVANQDTATSLSVAAPVAADQKPQEVKASQTEGHEITAPMVGTVYTAPSPDDPPFVKVGQQVKKGDVICIIEAMKLMNEVEAEVDGEVVEVLMENENMVEFGETLVVIS